MRQGENDCGEVSMSSRWKCCRGSGRASALTSIGMDKPGGDQLLNQSVNTLHYEDILREYFSIPKSVSEDSASQTFTKDELNAVRYASGYVPLTVLKMYERIKQHKCEEKVDQVKTCLGNMAVAGTETNFTQYTSDGFHRVNRGGLYLVNDETFAFFVAMEKVTRCHLPHQYKSTSKESQPKQVVIDTIVGDEDTQFYWTLISQDISEESNAIELLSTLAEKWVTMRGFSLSSSWLEEYEQVKKTKVSKKKALRKDLSKKSNPKPFLVGNPGRDECTTSTDEDSNMCID